jgi:dihydrolipoamide dehydrogenase
MRQGTEVLTAKNIIIATGARARDLPFAPADGKRIWTYRHAMTPPEMPRKLLVIGSGAIGIEFASFYNDLGAEVTVVEMMDRIVPVEDADVSAFLEKALKKQGMTIMTGAGSKRIEATARASRPRRSRRRTASGRPNSATSSSPSALCPTENIGLEALGVSDDKRGHIDTDAMCRTNVPRASGRSAMCTAPPWLAHKASHEGVIAAEGDRAGTGAIRTRWTPQHPGLHLLPSPDRSVGLTEAKAKEAGHEVKVGMFPFIGNGKAIALGEAGRLHQDRVRRRPANCSART